MRSFIYRRCHYLLCGLPKVVRRAAHPVPGPEAAKAGGFSKERKATAAVEFAIIGPVLLLIMAGLFVFGVALNNHVMLTNAAQAGALQFAISRGASQPYTETTAQIKGLTPTLDPTKLTITLSVNGTVCASDSSCQTALAANAGKPAFVQATYPCIPSNTNLTVMGWNYSTGCTLTVKTTERIQ